MEGDWVRSASPSPRYLVRTLGAEDVARLEALATVFGDAFGERATYTGRRPSEAYLRELLIADSFIAMIASEGDEVVGGLVAYELKKFERERSEIYLYDLAVAEGHRRQGLGTALIRGLQRVAATRNADVVFVQADLGDEPAISLYTKLGTREDVLHFDIDVGVDDNVS